MTKSDCSAMREVLAFWFAPGMEEKWFNSGEAFDIQVRDQLLPHYEAARAGAYDDWRDEPQGCLALCILLDQVPRNVFRGSAKAFETDAQALSITRHAIARGFDREMSQVERVFLYLPLEHSETLGDQEDCVRLIAELDQDPKWCDYAKRHRDIIARFGRFPHRNVALGREPTAEESEFLNQPGSSF